MVLQVKIGDAGYAESKGTVVVKPDNLSILNGASNYIGLQGAVAESDGLAFYYSYCEASGSDNIVFTLIDTSNGNKKQYTVTGKSLTTDTFKAISIDYSKFKEGAADIPDGCVDLGLSVFWASCNLGASKPTEYGGYYKWAEIKDDAASVALGGNWRMPTIEEWVELNNTDNCSWTWTSIDGVNGYKVQSKKSGYTDNWIFLPAAGYRSNDCLSGVGSYGNYWSSSLRTAVPSYAYDMGFTSDSFSGYNGIRYFGRSVRPVSE